MRVTTSRTTASARRRRLRCRRAGRTQGAGIGYGPARSPGHRELRCPACINDGRQVRTHKGPLRQARLRHPNAYQEPLPVSKPAQNPRSQPHRKRTRLKSVVLRQTQMVTPEQTGAMSAAGGHDGGDAGLMDAFTEAVAVGDPEPIRSGHLLRSFQLAHARGIRDLHQGLWL
jgi:hypothetical protein